MKKIKISKNKKRISQKPYISIRQISLVFSVLIVAIIAIFAIRSYVAPTQQSDAAVACTINNCRSLLTQNSRYNCNPSGQNPYCKLVRAGGSAYFCSCVQPTPTPIPSCAAIGGYCVNPLICAYSGGHSVNAKCSTAGTYCCKR